MPTYDYKCNSCNYEFEVFHSMLTEPLVDCPECNQPKLVKLIGPGAAVIIKGTENPCVGGRNNKTKKKKNLDKLGEGKNKGKKPFWRDGPVNKKILRNPKEYIREGRID